MTVLPIPDEEDEPIDPALVVLAARDLHRALKLYDQEGTLVLAGAPDPATGKNPAHEAWIRLGVLLNILPARDLRPAAQRKRAKERA